MKMLQKFCLVSVVAGCLLLGACTDPKEAQNGNGTTDSNSQTDFANGDSFVTDVEWDEEGGGEVELPRDDF